MTEKEYVVDVIYTSHGRAYLRANSEEEAIEKALKFDFESDEVIESDFDEVLIETLELND